MHKAVAIIPARYDATRFPGKPLALLKGKPLIQYVYENAAHASLIDTVFIATDDRRIFDTVTNFGGEAVMTSSSHASGTDRIAEVADKLECEFVINIQGDEPFIRPEMIDEAINLLYNDDRVSISTLAKRITDLREILSSNVVKVVIDDEGFALYFSRSPIPYYRDEFSELRVTSYELQTAETRTRNPQPATRNLEFYKHIGIYGYRKKALLEFASMKQNKLELIEKLEQLRALACGMKIKVKETEFDTFGIDTIEDLKKAEEWQSISL